MIVKSAVEQDYLARMTNGKKVSKWDVIVANRNHILNSNPFLFHLLINGEFT